MRVCLTCLASASGRLPPKLSEQRSALLLFCSHRCFGYVPRGQWALLGADMLVLIDRSACLVEPLHLWSAHQVLASLVVRSLRRTVFAPALSLRDLDLLLDDLHSFSTHLDDLPARCWILSWRHSAGTFGFSSSQWACVLRLQPVDQGCDRSSHLANVLDFITTSIVVCACSRVSSRTEPPLLESA